MQLSQLRAKKQVLISMVAIITAWRVATHFIDHGNQWLNLSPMYAVLLFSAACFQRPESLVVPLAALFVSDVILCFTVYAPFRSGVLYEGWYWVYGAFVLASLVCSQMLKKFTAARLVTALLMTSVIHWLVATLSVCMEQAQTSDVIHAYFRLLWPALDYEWKLLAGTCVYGLVLFASWHVYRKKLFTRLTV